MVVMPRVDGWRHIRVVVGKRRFSHGEFAQHHRACFAQALDHGAVIAGFEVAHHRHASGGGDVFGVAQVFERDGHAVQGTQNLATHDHGLCVSRLLQSRVMCDGGIGQQTLVDALYAAQHHLREFNAGQFFTVQQPRQ